jgi:hypothetical protein
MSHVVRVLVFVAVMTLLPVTVTRAGDSAAEAKRANEVRKKLDATIDFPGISDPDTTFGAALDFLGRAAGVTFEVNEQAFKDEMIDDVSTKPLGREIPKMTGVAAEKALRRILGRIPVYTGATFMVRGGVVEITTRRYASPSQWRLKSIAEDEGSLQSPPPPVVSVAFDSRELRDALQEIADATSVNIILDARAKEKAKAAVTTTVRDAAVDTLVQLLADMADLQAVTVDDMIYVTTKENAKALRKEKARIKKAEEAQP